MSQPASNGATPAKGPAAQASSGHSANLTKEHRASSAESLDEVVSTTTAKGWIAAVALVVLLVALLVWSVVATVPQQISTQASVNAAQGIVAVAAPTTGEVQVDVVAGARVEKGQKLATVVPFTGRGATTVAAPEAGRVAGVGVVNGQGVTQGDTMLRLDASERSGDLGVLVAFVPAAQAQLYSVGSEVEVSLDDLTTGVASEATAVIKEVSGAPATEAEITSAVGSEVLAQNISTTTEGAAYRIDFQFADPSTAPADLQPGQVVQIQNTYATPKPIQLLFGGR